VPDMASTLGWAVAEILSMRQPWTTAIHIHILTAIQSATRPMQTPKVGPSGRFCLLEANAHTEPAAGQKEIFTSWALSILIVLLIVALFTSYTLQTRKIQAVHETVLSIFAGTSA
jgi:hypothetical protein